MPYVPPKYPGEIPTAEDLPDRTDDIDWLYAARYNELKKELRAALIELGVDPAGAFDTVVARLDAAAIGDKISEGDSSVEVIDTDADGHVEIKTENALCGKFNSDGILDLPKQSSCRVYRTPRQTIPTVTWTKLELNAENWDTQNEFDITTNHRFTATKAGKYFFSAIITLKALGDGKRLVISIVKNDVYQDQAIFWIGGTGDISVAISEILSLAANDFVELFVLHDHGVDREIDLGFNRTSFAITKIA